MNKYITNRGICMENNTKVGIVIFAWYMSFVYFMAQSGFLLPFFGGICSTALTVYIVFYIMKSANRRK